MTIQSTPLVVERWTCNGPDECGAPCVELVQASDYDRLERSHAELVEALEVAIHRLEAHEEPEENDDIRAALEAAGKVGHE